METTHPREYKSPRRKLLRFFEKSRDKWKLKYREVKLQAQLAALKASHLEKEDANEALKKRVISRHPL